MAEGWSYLVTGIALGLAGGFAPGPITTLVIVQSLRYGLKEGLRIAIAPLLTDAPIALAALFVISKLDDTGPALGTITLMGSAFLIYLAYENAFAQPPQTTAVVDLPRSLRKGIVTNLVNPNPYLFWFTIGAPTVVEAYPNGVFVGLFLVGLYSALIGSKATFAVVAAKGRSLLAGTVYRYTLVVLSLVLLGLALKFASDGLGYLGVL